MKPEYAWLAMLVTGIVLGILFKPSSVGKLIVSVLVCGIAVSVFGIATDSIRGESLFVTAMAMPMAGGIIYLVAVIADAVVRKLVKPRAATRGDSADER